MNRQHAACLSILSFWFSRKPRQYTRFSRAEPSFFWSGLLVCVSLSIENPIIGKSQDGLQRAFWRRKSSYQPCRIVSPWMTKNKRPRYQTDPRTGFDSSHTTRFCCCVHFLGLSRKAKRYALPPNLTRPPSLISFISDNPFSCPMD